jgi:hypothetical protein
VKQLFEIKTSKDYTDSNGRQLPEIERWSGEIWYLEDDTGSGDGEFFDERPTTPGVGGDLASWPDEYTLRVGNINGGDSLVIEHRDQRGQVWVRSDDDHRFWRLETAG